MIDFYGIKIFTLFLLKNPEQCRYRDAVQFEVQ